LGEKIKSLAQLGEIAERERGNGRRIVLCHGVFDLLHPGHIRHLGEAKRLGDLLFVTITRDALVNKGPGRPAFPESLRAESLAALTDVDFVAINDTPTAVEPIRAIRPDYYVKGSDYEKRSDDVTGGIYEEEAAVRECGGRLHFTREVTFSSTSLLNSHFGVYPEEARAFLQELKREWPAERLLESLRRLERLKVCVIGDTILDEYHYCQPLGKSPKDTLVTARYLREETFAGGILACANHLAELVGEVELVTVLGARDSRESWIRGHLAPGITPRFFLREGAGTIRKRRYVESSSLAKLFGVSFFDDTELPRELSGEIHRYLVERLPRFDLVLVGDYGHGFLNRDLIELICRHSPFLALNVQTNSANLGYNLVTKYPRADYICQDENELRLALQSRHAPAEALLDELSRRYPEATLTVTRGAKGSLTLQPDRTTLACPTLSRRIVDRTGTGDAYFAVSSLLAAERVPAGPLALVGNAAGAMAAEVVGNRSSVRAAPLLKFLKALLS
jgi:rfaE bifunctional protein nucleotidyltransferase chain/domain